MSLTVILGVAGVVVSGVYLVAVIVSEVQARRRARRAVAALKQLSQDLRQAGLENDQSE